MLDFGHDVDYTIITSVFLGVDNMPEVLRRRYDMAQEQIGRRENATKTYKVGGTAFPTDYNWVCPVCGEECRAFENTCYTCQVENWQAKKGCIDMDMCQDK